MPRNLYISQL